MKFLLASVMAAMVWCQRTIVETAVTTPALSTLVSVLTAPGYEPILNALNSPGTYTVFAPSNEAFARAGIDPSNVDLVSQVLLYHVLGVTVRSTDLAAGKNFAPTLMTDARFVTRGGRGQELNVERSATGVRVLGDLSQQPANVAVADVICSNGVVHVVDQVIFPFPRDAAALATAAGLTTLLAAVVKAGLADAVVNTPSITIFAPTNAAFARVNWEALPVPALINVLTYHVVPAVAWSTGLSNGQNVPTLQGSPIRVAVGAGGVRLNDRANVAVADVIAKNGAIHVIDEVLLPPALKAELGLQQSIVDTAVATPSLSTLVKIVTLPDYKPILDVLSGAGPFTVFAPSNDAFARDPWLNVSRVDFITNVLKYHVVAGKALSSDLTNGQRVTTVLGDTVTVHLRQTPTAKEVFINQAEVTTADVIATNGVVHIVNRVLLPF
jgi:transforming growth factor-beta-induced protein